MGSSRTILLSGIYAMLGVYTLGIREADIMPYRIAAAHADQLQAEEIAKIGVQLCINDLGSSKPTALPFAWEKSVVGGKLTYYSNDAGLASDQVRIISIGKFNGQRATRVAVVKLIGTYTSTSGKKKKWNKWMTERVYTTVNESEFNTWN
ncbi:MAG TPA: hypothetical protein VNN76_07195 [Bacteroidota bacterium]|nr:hypothetical protein [Bacteroidota bacterium]